MHEKMARRKDDWRQHLPPEHDPGARRHGIEPADSGRHRAFNASGIIHCVYCGNALVSSNAKIVAKSKWPEFLAPIATERVKSANDIFSLTVRKDVLCGNCNARLGYVCNDGRIPASVHYFINSVVLTFNECSGCNAETALVSNKRSTS